jgi:photosystem II stability/assembly factor-like uncharacterized protein
MPAILVASGAGLFIANQKNDELQIIRHTLQNQPLTSVAATKTIIVVGGPNGMMRSADQGQSWQSINIDPKHIRWLGSPESQDELILAGTEPAGIIVSRDGGHRWNQSPDVFRLRDAHGWFLPYSPEAGCVRGFAFAESVHGARIYAAVEVGGVLISTNMGKSWQLADGSDGVPDFSRDLGTMIHPDVHSICAHPQSNQIVTAPTGGGLFRSHDAGRSWINIYTCYIRAAWVDPADPEHIIAGPAEYVSRNGRIEESMDGGQSWQNSAHGLQTPWPRHMVERFFQADGQLYAVLSNGELLQRSLQGKNWRRVLEQISSAAAVA